MHRIPSSPGESKETFTTGRPPTGNISYCDRNITLKKTVFKNQYFVIKICFSVNYYTCVDTKNEMLGLPLSNSTTSVRGL